ncbi:CDP-glucose 4,6-dehydratase [Pedobacter nutrimenti]|uniref:CDP-glucose 4,6-dehydratase n=1 Tax=Pedobacter nutrimenti TaxID=1241337 RepID=UPI002931C24B|nr:CDP-glucose 4,6-dehydratase [Pedobacter nutrimenti]
MEIGKLFNGVFNHKTILVTGDTGFKGSWLALWLEKLGARVYGVSLEPNTNPNHFDITERKYKTHIQDINDRGAIASLISEIKPDLIFHLAAQPLVRLSYDDPYNTYLTNVIGTVNVLDASRGCSNLKGVVVVTSDKCYENNEWLWGYRENEPMGGKDPYSSSKGCAELITAAYRHSYFPNNKFGETHNTLIASVRAGNVIGGGDWAVDRIVPDMVKAANQRETLYLRFPNATRPWQHVLEPLSGYLNIGQKLLEGDSKAAEAWNFGPSAESNLTVRELVEESTKLWIDINYEIENKSHVQEANFLMLDSSKANKLLNWKPVWDFKETIKQTIGWYKTYYTLNEVISESQLEQYIKDAINKKTGWATQ